jgi:Sulfotransferase family
MSGTSKVGCGRGAQLETHGLLDAARRATGLADFGDPWFLEPLGSLVNFINAESGLISSDSMPVHILVGTLGDRLKRVEYLKRHPEVLDEDVRVAGMIIGLPRGGSTLLQRLLSTSPQLTSTYWWELLNPIPLPGEKPNDPTPRHAFAQATAAQMQALWPEIISMHPIEPLGYDEEVQLTERSLLSIMYPFYFYVPGYVGWQMQQDHTKAYEELRLWLQVLQFQDAGRRGRKWLLKSPHHLLSGGLGTALRTFPDAKVLMTHRAIEDVIPSFCSLQSTMLSPISSTFDRALLGQQGIDWFSRAIRLLMAVRKSHPADRFIDVQYRDMMTAPIDQFRRVMGLMGLPVRSEDEREAERWMAVNGRDTHPRHKYAPETYGVSRAQIAEAFGFYRDAFLDRG